MKPIFYCCTDWWRIQYVSRSTIPYRYVCGGLKTNATIEGSNIPVIIYANYNNDNKLTYNGYDYLSPRMIQKLKDRYRYNNVVELRGVVIGMPPGTVFDIEFDTPKEIVEYYDRLKNHSTDPFLDDDTWAKQLLICYNPPISYKNIY